MIPITSVLSNLPQSLREELVEEYSLIINNFSEGKWRPAELSGGRFSEIVYTILEGVTKGRFPNKAYKPKNFVDSCRKLEMDSSVPRSFQVLIPRLLPALYEIRNNRNVGHVGGDVNPDFMDSSIVVSIAGWIMAELVRVFHDTTTREAEIIVSSLVERRIPVVWVSEDIKRVLRPDLKLHDQIMILISSCIGSVKIEDLFDWLDYDNKNYFNNILKSLHKKRQINLDIKRNEVQILPPGIKYVSELLLRLD